MILPLHSSILLDLLHPALKWSARIVEERMEKAFHRLGFNQNQKLTDTLDCTLWAVLHKKTGIPHDSVPNMD